MAQLLTSRRLWTFVVAQVVAIAAFVIANYVHDPAASQLAGLLIGMVEGIAGIVIAAFTVDDVKLNTSTVAANKEIELAAIAQGTHPDFPPTDKP
jgi:hypothetical protein